MTLQADLAALDRASRRLAEIRDALVDDHAALRARVDGLLGSGWSGAASAQFDGAWRRWCEGASGVLSGLGEEAAAISATRAELAGADEERAQASRRLQHLLGQPRGSVRR
jgi:WXG100 family type VII secretion target